MIWEVFNTILTLIIAYGISVFFHELGHYKSFQRIGRKVELKVRWGIIEWGTPKDYEGLTNKQLFGIYFTAVVVGTLPLLVAGILFHWAAYLLLVPYFMWSRSDIRNAWRCRK